MVNDVLNILDGGFYRIIKWEIDAPSITMKLAISIMLLWTHYLLILITKKKFDITFRVSGRVFFINMKLSSLYFKLLKIKLLYPRSLSSLKLFIKELTTQFTWGVYWNRRSYFALSAEIVAANVLWVVFICYHSTKRTLVRIIDFLSS